MRPALVPRGALLAWAAASLLAAPAPAQTTIEILPAVDFYVEDTGRDGSFDVVRDGASTLVVGTTPLEVFRIAVEFDLTAIPAGNRITAASLSLRRVSGSLFQPDVDLYAYPSQTADGVASVGDVTSLDDPLVLGQPVPFGTLVLTLEDPSLVDYVDTTYARGDTFLGLMLKISDESGGTAVHEFATSENAPADAPKLSVTFEPAPAVPLLSPGGAAALGVALLLVGIGAGGRWREPGPRARPGPAPPGAPAARA